MKRGSDKARTGPRPPARLCAEMLGKRNRALNQQTRKVLGRHYAARYRVR